MAEQVKKGPAPKKESGDQADAATQEVAPGERTISVGDKDFTIPDSQPSEILFSARAISRSTRTGDEGAAVEAMMDMAVAYIGEENLRNLLAEQNLEEGMATVEEILSSAAESYGTDSGE